MSVFRVERTRNYTVMSNHHLRSKSLSLKAKALMSLILSLPDDWDYTLNGLAYISLEKIDAVRRAVKEVENEGYISRCRIRDNQGKLRGTEYIIREQPSLDKPMLENPMLDKPTLENPTQLNTYRENKDKVNTESIPFITTGSVSDALKENGTELMRTYEKIVKENIEYSSICKTLEKTRLDEIVTLIVETLCSSKKTIRVASDDFPAEAVKSKLLKLDSAHIEFVFDCLNENATKIRNIKQYLLTLLFNAPNTIDNYYSSLVNYDLNGGP